MNRFKILGINDDKSTCSCCGKQGLKKVVWIEDTETGSLDHFGVICALKPSKCFGLTKADFREHELVWKTKEAMKWSKVRREYKARGGKFEMVDAYTCAASDKALWNECIALEA